VHALVCQTLGGPVPFDTVRCMASAPPAVADDPVWAPDYVSASAVFAGRTAGATQLVPGGHVAYTIETAAVGPVSLLMRVAGDKGTLVIDSSTHSVFLGAPATCLSRCCD
jgi:hypothetical protein